MKPDRPVARRGDYTFRECGPAVARSLVEAHHYSKSCSHRAFSICAFRGDEPIGVAQILPPLPPAAKKHARTDPKRVRVLTRLVVVPGEPQNAAGMLIAALLHQLRREGRYDRVLTYADMAQGHTGVVYRATNAKFLGMSEPEPYWVDLASGVRVSRKSTVSRTNAQMRALGCEQRVSPGKYIFAWDL